MRRLWRHWLIPLMHGMAAASLPALVCLAAPPQHSPPHRPLRPHQHPQARRAPVAPPAGPWSPPLLLLAPAHRSNPQQTS